MASGGALLRLLARPVMLWTLLPLGWAIVIPLAIAAEAGGSLSELWTGTASGSVRVAAWHLGVLVPAVIGFAVSIARLELQHAPLSWALPGVSRGLLTGTLVIALPIAAAAALVVARTAAPGTSLMAAAAAFSLALFWYVAAGSALDVALPRLLRWLGLLAIFIAAVRPVLLADAVAAAPAVVAAIAAAVSLCVLAVQFSHAAARRRHFRWSSFASHQRALYWGTRPRSTLHWAGDLATDRMLPWLRAMAYESSPRGGRTLPTVYMLMAGLTALSAHITGSVSQAIVIGGILLSQRSLGLSPGLNYPLSRRQRADLLTVAALGQAAMFTLLVGALFWLIKAAGVPVPMWFLDETTRSAGWWPALGLMFAWAPLAQWDLVSRGHLGTAGEVDARRVLFYMGYVIPAVISARLLDGRDVGVATACVVAIAVTGYTLLWILARRHHARADLVRAGA
jgi:hypothetical protein